MLYPTDLLCLPAPKTSISTQESPADPQAVRLAQLERELARTQQQLIQARDVIRSQQRKIQRLLPATPPPPARESDRVRFVTLRPTEPLQRLSGQQQIHDLLAAGWQIHSMTALPGDPPAVAVLLTHPDARPASTSRAATARTVRPRPTTTLAGKSAPIVVDAHDETLTYAEALRAPRGAFTDAELAEIANREVHAAARRAYERAGDSSLSETLTRLNTRRSSDAARQ